MEDSALAAAFEYEYDALGRRLSRAVKSSQNGDWVDDNHSVLWQYDAAGRLTSMNNVLGTFGFDYVEPDKGLGRLAAVQYPNGQRVTYAYQPVGQYRRLAGIEHRRADDSLIARITERSIPSKTITVKFHL